MYKLLVTSAAEHDGKSTICKRLARERTGIGEKVLLMDLDFMESARIGLGNGVTEYIYSHGSIGADIIEEDCYNVIIPGRIKGRLSNNPRDRMFFEKFLKEFDEKYNTAIIDTPPLLYVSDALFYCQYCDEIIVVNSGKSNTELAIDRLKKAGFQARIVDNFF